MGIASTVPLANHHQQSFNPPGLAPKVFLAQNLRCSDYHCNQHQRVQYLDSRQTANITKVHCDQQRLGQMREGLISRNRCQPQLVFHEDREEAVTWSGFVKVSAFADL